MKIPSPSSSSSSSFSRFLSLFLLLLALLTVVDARRKSFRRVWPHTNSGHFQFNFCLPPFSCAAQKHLSPSKLQTMMRRDCPVEEEERQEKMAKPSNGWTGKSRRHRASHKAKVASHCRVALAHPSGSSHNMLLHAFSVWTRYGS
jgi:hypothetical protein